MKVLEIRSSQIKEIKALFVEYAQWIGIDLSFQHFQNELDSLPGVYSPPDGALLVATVDGKVGGCVALRKISESVCEMKRLYVRPQHRNLGIGKELVNRIIRQAVSKNYMFMRLDTLPVMQTAQRLYESFGFYEIAPYVYNPIEGARFMELDLGKFVKQSEKRDDP